MEPKLLRIPAFQVTGTAVRTSNAFESDTQQAKLAKHWARFFSENVPEKIPHRVTDSPVYGVYHNYESDHSGDFDLLSGVATIAGVHQGQNVFTQVLVSEGNYLMFKAQGSFPENVISVWSTIWQYFETHKHIKRAYTTDFECYAGPTDVAVYISLVSAE